MMGATMGMRNLPYSLYLILLFPILSRSSPINRQVGLTENVFITVRNDTYGNEQRVCSIDSMTYEDGESIPTSSPCEHCVCRPPGFACTIISCEYRSGCKAIKRSDQCCPEYRCECEKNGKIYQNGEKIVDSNNPCEVCYCQGGEIICAVIDCYWRSDCQPRYIENRCCPLYDHCVPPQEKGPLNRPLFGLSSVQPTPTTTTSFASWFNLSSAVYETRPTTEVSSTPKEKVTISAPPQIGLVQHVRPVIDLSKDKFVEDQKINNASEPVLEYGESADKDTESLTMDIGEKEKPVVEKNDDSGSNDSVNNEDSLKKKEEKDKLESIIPTMSTVYEHTSEGESGQEKSEETTPIGQYLDFNVNSTEKEQTSSPSSSSQQSNHVFLNKAESTTVQLSYAQSNEVTSVEAAYDKGIASQQNLDNKAAEVTEISETKEKIAEGEENDGITSATMGAIYQHNLHKAAQVLDDEANKNVIEQTPPAEVSVTEVTSEVAEMDSLGTTIMPSSKENLEFVEKAQMDESVITETPQILDTVATSFFDDAVIEEMNEMKSSAVADDFIFTTEGSMLADGKIEGSESSATEVTSLEEKKPVDSQGLVEVEGVKGTESEIFAGRVSQEDVTNTIRVDDSTMIPTILSTQHDEASSNIETRADTVSPTLFSSDVEKTTVGQRQSQLREDAELLDGKIETTAYVDTATEPVDRDFRTDIQLDESFINVSANDENSETMLNEEINFTEDSYVAETSQAPSRLRTDLLMSDEAILATDFPQEDIVTEGMNGSTKKLTSGDKGQVKKQETDFASEIEAITVSGMPTDFRSEIGESATAQAENLEEYSTVAYDLRAGEISRTEAPVEDFSTPVQYDELAMSSFRNMYKTDSDPKETTTPPSLIEANSSTSNDFEDSVPVSKFRSGIDHAAEVQSMEEKDSEGAKPMKEVTTFAPAQFVESATEASLLGAERFRHDLFDEVVSKSEEQVATTESSKYEIEEATEMYEIGKSSIDLSEDDRTTSSSNDVAFEEKFIGTATTDMNDTFRDSNESNPTEAVAIVEERKGITAVPMVSSAETTVSIRSFRTDIEDLDKDSFETESSRDKDVLTTEIPLEKAVDEKPMKIKRTKVEIETQHMPKHDDSESSEKESPKIYVGIANIKKDADNFFLASSSEDDPEKIKSENQLRIQTEYYGEDQTMLTNEATTNRDIKPDSKETMHRKNLDAAPPATEQFIASESSEVSQKEQNIQQDEEVEELSPKFRFDLFGIPEGDEETVTEAFLMEGVAKAPSPPLDMFIKKDLSRSENKPKVEEAAIEDDKSYWTFLNDLMTTTYKPLKEDFAQTTSQYEKVSDLSQQQNASQESMTISTSASLPEVTDRKVSYRHHTDDHIETTMMPRIDDSRFRSDLVFTDASSSKESELEETMKDDSEVEMTRRPPVRSSESIPDSEMPTTDHSDLEYRSGPEVTVMQDQDFKEAVTTHPPIPFRSEVDFSTTPLPLFRHDGQEVEEILTTEIMEDLVRIDSNIEEEPQIATTYRSLEEPKSVEEGLETTTEEVAVFKESKKVNVLIPENGFPVVDPIAPEIEKNSNIPHDLARFDLTRDDSWLSRTFLRVRRLARTLMGLSGPKVTKLSKKKLANIIKKRHQSKDTKQIRKTE